MSSPKAPRYLDPHLVPPGRYSVLARAWHVGNAFNESKLRLDLQLLDHLDILLPRWYRIGGHHRSRISASPQSDLVREVQLVTGKRIRCDRIPVGEFLKAGVLLADIETVKQDSRQQQLAEVNRYSVVRRIIGKDE